jgi:hypothetical protein
MYRCDRREQRADCRACGPSSTYCLEIFRFFGRVNRFGPLFKSSPCTAKTGRLLYARMRFPLVL